MLVPLKQLLEDDSGATAVEYGIMVALVAVAIIIAVSTLGIFVSDTLFEATEGAINDATGT
jgi:pilus assembly protein Flp/PilA